MTTSGRHVGNHGNEADFLRILGDFGFSEKIAVNGVRFWAKIILAALRIPTPPGPTIASAAMPGFSY